MVGAGQGRDAEACPLSAPVHPGLRRGQSGGCLPRSHWQAQPGEAGRHMCRQAGGGSGREEQGARRTCRLAVVGHRSPQAKPRPQSRPGSGHADPSESGSVHALIISVHWTGQAGVWGADGKKLAHPICELPELVFPRELVTEDGEDQLHAVDWSLLDHRTSVYTCKQGSGVSPGCGQWQSIAPDDEGVLWIKVTGVPHIYETLCSIACERRRTEHRSSRDSGLASIGPNSTTDSATLTPDKTLRQP